jgi:hypothetical protein
VRPFREQHDPTDPIAVAGAALLSRVPPLEVSIDRRRRVRLALQAPRRSARIFSPVLVAGILLVAATGASATVTRIWKISHAWHAADRSFIESSPRPSKPAMLEPKAPPAPGVLETAPVSVPEPKLETASVAPRASMLPHRSAAPHAPAATQASDPTSGPGAALMVEAMQARKAGDASRASALLTEYQHKYPQGAFQEEALALSIESAATRRSDSAAGLAAEYLRRYPNGRFRALAQRVLKGTH